MVKSNLDAIALDNRHYCSNYEIMRSLRPIQQDSVAYTHISFQTQYITR
ncbi:hypothetical protein [Nostoc sp.]